MKSTLTVSIRVVVAFSTLTTFASAKGSLAVAITVPQGQYQSQTEDKSKAMEVPEAERQAAMKVLNAADTLTRLQAAGEFIKKFPKSKQRPEIAQRIAAKIAEVEDTRQRITLSESFLAVFKEESEASFIKPVLMDAYIKVDRLDDAFQLASAWLEKNPEDVAALTQMTLIGTEQVKRGNAKYLQQSQQYGAKAIELIEAEKRGKLDDAQWKEYKTKWLGHLYQSLGILSLVTRNNEDARAKLQKAAAINQNDPFNYLLIGQVINDEYQQMAQKYRAMTPGPAQDEMLKQIHGQLDKIIELYARAVALSEGNAQYQQLHDQVMQDLRSYYKYRHNGSEEGLRQLIDKYKKAPATP